MRSNDKGALIFKLFFLSFVSSIFLSGCAFFDSSNIKPTRLKQVEETLKIKVSWKKKVGPITSIDSGPMSFTPVVVGDLVIASSSNGSISIFNLADGNLVDKIKLEENLLSSAAYKERSSGITLAVILETGELGLIEPGKGFLWRIPLDGITRLPPFLDEDTVVIKYADNRIFGYDVETGQRVWNITRRVPSLTLHGQSGMRFFAETDVNSGLGSSLEGLAVNMAGGRLMVLNPKTGALEWEIRAVYPRGTNEVERIVDLIGLPFINADEVCSTSYQTKIICLRTTDGEIIWSRDFMAMKPAVFKKPFAASVDFDDKLVAFDWVQNKKLWDNEDLLFRGLSGLIIWDDLLWAIDDYGILHGINLESGNIISRFNVGDGGLAGDPIPTTSGLLLQTISGSLLMLEK